jgi:valyl-tRNA synthetase
MILKHVLEDIARSSFHPYDETNIESVEQGNGGIFFEIASKEEDVTKIEELTDEVEKLKEELAQLKTEIGREEFISEAKEELENLRKNIEREAENKVKRWETFARKCYESLTPKWKEKMRHEVISMNKFIEEANKEVMTHEKFE